MLISKWAVIRAIVDYNPMLEIFLVFGSAATIFFWVKWMGRLVTVCENYGNIEGKMNRADFLPLLSLSALTVGLCLFFPLTCRLVVEPYLIELYDKTVIINQENLIIMFLMLGMVVLFPLSFLYSGRKAKIVAPYLGAANSGQFSFRGQGGKEERMEMKNYYLAKYLGEDKLLPHASLICGILLIAVFAVAWVVRCW
jgi:ech hydrogenase subunit A